MAQSFDDAIDEIISGIITVGGGIDQADLLTQIVQMATDMATTQHNVGLGLINFIRDEMSDPFNILNASALFGQQGGGTMGVDSEGFGQPSAFGPLFDELLQSVSQFALGNFELPDFPDTTDGGDGGDADGDGIRDDRDLPGETAFSQDEFLAKVNNLTQFNQTDATWFLQYADFWESQGGQGDRVNTARAYATLINEVNAGITTPENAEARLREILAGGGVTPSQPPSDQRPDPRRDLPGEVKFSQDEFIAKVNSLGNFSAEDATWFQEYASFWAANGGSGSRISTARAYARVIEEVNTGTLDPSGAQARIRELITTGAAETQATTAGATPLGFKPTTTVSPLSAVQTAGVPLSTTEQPKKTVL